MNATLIDDESNLDNQREKSTPHNTGNFMAFTLVVKSESLEDLEKSYAS